MDSNCSKELNDLDSIESSISPHAWTEAYVLVEVEGGPNYVVTHKCYQCGMIVVKLLGAFASGPELNTPCAFSDE